MQKRLLSCAIALIVLCAIALGVVYLRDRQRLSSEMERKIAQERYRAAEQVVGDAIIAVKDKDITYLSSLLYSKSLETLSIAHPKRYPKVINATIKDYGLDTISKEDIRTTIRAVPHVRRKLMESYLLLITGQCSNAGWPTWEKDTPVVVTYKIRGISMISVALCEKGKWKIASTPLSLSANILNYKTISEANRHGDALVKPPFEKE